MAHAEAAFLEQDMAKTPGKRRTDAAAATRRWRGRQARRMQLVTLEVGEATLGRLVAAGLVPAEVRHIGPPRSYPQPAAGIEKHLAGHVTGVWVTGKTLPRLGGSP